MAASLRRSCPADGRDLKHNSGMADDAIVVFASNHGDVLGAHGGMLQEWCNAYDEAVRMPLLVKGS